MADRYAGKLLLSTATTIQLGPFLDISDFSTAEGGLTIEDTEIWLSKNGGAFAVKNDTNNAAVDSLGFYRAQLNTTDTNTLGNLIIHVNDALAHPVTQTYEVVSLDEGFGAEEVFYGYVKQSTAREVIVGPFIGSRSLLPLTAITVASITTSLTKDGSPPTQTTITWAASGSVNDMVHIGNGYWRCELTASNTDTLGPLVLSFELTGTFRGPKTYRFFVLEDHVYDGLLAGTDNLEVDTVQALGSAVTLSSDNRLQVDCVEINDTPLAASGLANAVNSVSADVDVNVVRVSGDAGAADNLELALDGGTYNVGGGAIECDMTKISGSAAAANNWEEAALAALTFQVEETGFTATTTEFETDEITEATASRLVDRIVMFTRAGERNYLEAKKITAYSVVGGRGHITCDAFTRSPADGETGVIL